jgi:hypothetical protein
VAAAGSSSIHPNEDATSDVLSWHEGLPSHRVRELASPLITGAIEVDEIACNHQLLAHPPFTGQVGQLLAAAIERGSVPVRQR